MIDDVFIAIHSTRVRSRRRFRRVRAEFVYRKVGRRVRSDDEE